MTMKMVFHFARCDASDITVEGENYGDCTQKAYFARLAQVTPTKIQGEVVE